MHPLVMRALQKAVVPAGRWLIRQVGVEWILKRLEAAVDGIGHRQHAIAKARSLADGRLGSVIIEDSTRWVVYAGKEPRVAFPSIKGDLAEEMRGYDLTRLRRPDELATARARGWTSGRLAGLRDRLRREGAAAGDDTATTTVADGNGSSATIAEVEAQIGHVAFDAVIAQMPALLNRLSACPAKPAAEHAAMPAAPGIYLFSQGPTPMYVGNTRNLRQRLRQHTGTASRENQAAFAWRLALKDAEDAGLSISGTRKEFEADTEFEELFRRARERVAAMEVRFIEIDDPIARTLFEVYAAQALGTDEFNSFETH